MLETTIPEINVTELMERVRREAARIELNRPRPAPSVGSVTRLADIRISPPEAEPASAAKKLSVPRAKLEELVQRGREKNDRPGVPRLFRRFFRKQGSYNRVISQTNEILSRSVIELTQRVNELSLAMQRQSQWTAAISRYEHEVQRWILQTTHRFTFLDERTAALRSEIDAAGQHLRNLQAEVDRLALCVSNLEQERASESQALSAFSAEKAALNEHLRNLQAEADRLGLCVSNLQQDQAVEAKTLNSNAVEKAALTEHLRNLQAEVDRLGLCVTNLQKDTAVGAERFHAFDLRIHDQAAAKNSLEQLLIHLEERVTNDAAYIKAELSQQAQAMRRLRATDGRPSGKQKTPGQSADDHWLDAFYVSFENRFRGPRRDIKRRLEFYLPYISATGAGATDRPVLDLGCGRGEWLELLKEQKLAGRGVDINSAMIAQCQERGLEVVEADAIEYLRSLPKSSLGAITGFHIIEHLPLRTLLELVAESYRALQPGGVLIFESPNCKNILVGATNFYIDPTHRNPVFPDTASFILDSFGFTRIELQYLSPAEERSSDHNGAGVAVLHELLYGPQDFAAIGYKPK